MNPGIKLGIWHDCWNKTITMWGDNVLFIKKNFTFWGKIRWYKTVGFNRSEFHFRIPRRTKGQDQDSILMENVIKMQSSIFLQSNRRKSTALTGDVLFWFDKKALSFDQASDHCYISFDSHDILLRDSHEGSNLEQKQNVLHLMMWSHTCMLLHISLSLVNTVFMNHNLTGEASPRLALLLKDAVWKEFADSLRRANGHHQDAQSEADVCFWQLSWNTVSDPLQSSERQADKRSRWDTNAWPFGGEDRAPSFIFD